MTPDRKPGLTQAPDGHAADRVSDTPTLETELGTLFRRARELFRSAASDVHPELNITGYVALVRIVEDGPLRAATLVDQLGTDKGTISRQLAQLERLGLVRREPDPLDGRAQVVSASTTAVRRCALARERSRARLRRRISDWPAEQVDEFAALLRDFNVALATDLR